MSTCSYADVFVSACVHIMMVFVCSLFSFVHNYVRLHGGVMSNNIDESMKVNVNLIEELIDVRNGVKWVHIFDMQNSMCIIHL